MMRVLIGQLDSSGRCLTSLYVIAGVAVDATQVELDAAYAGEFGRSQGIMKLLRSSFGFRRVSRLRKLHAFAILTDPSARQSYDASPQRYEAINRDLLGMP